MGLCLKAQAHFVYILINILFPENFMQQTGKEMLLAAVCFFWVTAKMRSGANSAVHIHNMRPDHDHILAAAPDHCNNATGMIQCMCVRFTFVSEPKAKPCRTVRQ